MAAAVQRRLRVAIGLQALQRSLKPQRRRRTATRVAPWPPTNVSIQGLNSTQLFEAPTGYPWRFTGKNRVAPGRLQLTTDNSQPTNFSGFLTCEISCNLCPHPPQ